MIYPFIRCLIDRIYEEIENCPIKTVFTPCLDGMNQAFGRNGGEKWNPTDLDALR